MEGDPAESEQSIIALCYARNYLGLACYEEVSNSICCDALHVPIEDVEQTIMNIKVSLRPTMFLLHPKLLANKPLLDMVLSGIDGSPETYRFKVLKSSAWNDRICSATIHHSLSIRMGGALVSGTAQYQQMASMVDFDSDQCRQALGALVAYMQESVFKLDGGKVTVTDLKNFAQESCLQIDQSSLNALQIFAEEVHPNVMKGKGRSKEGFSLFGLFDRTNSLPGRQRLRDWMTRPLCDKAKILHRQKGVALVVRQSNRDFVAGSCALLRHFHDLPRLLLRVKKVEAGYVEWCSIHTSLATAQKLLDHVGAFVENPMTDTDDGNYLRALFERINMGALHQLSHTLQSALDVSQSKVEAAVVFREGYDAVLDRLRQTFDHLETHLVRAAHQVLEVVPLLQNVSVEYVPQVGYLVAVQESEVHLLEACLPSLPATLPAPHPMAQEAGGEFGDWVYEGVAAEDAGLFPVLDHPLADVSTTHVEDDRFRFVFQQAGVHYFKHRIVEALDASVGDIKSDIADRQRVLLLQLEEILLDCESDLLQLSIALSALDALISLGTLAVEQCLVAPEIVDQSVILIKAGRHLLQELTVDNFVPNDTYISPEKNVALISGPNTSGKSVYLKQVALMVYLAHIGSYVPCQRARIGLTDRIFTRIASTETVSAPQSAFALDLMQVSRMLRAHTKRSLCLVDEFGKGTMPVDGIALLAAVVKHFAERGGSAVFVLHFTEILHDAILSAEVMQRVSCFRMETLQSPEGDDEDDGTCYRERTPLFTLKNGVATSSVGIPCARSAGVEEAVLQRAAQIKHQVAQRQPIQPHASRAQSIFRDPRHAELLVKFLSAKNWTSDEGCKLLPDLLACL